MKEIAPLTEMRPICNRYGRLFRIHEDMVWTGNKTCHEECWMQEKRDGVPE